MADVTLKASRPTITVRIGDEQHDVPLTFTRAELETIGTAEDKTAAINDYFFRKYLGDVVDDLGDDDLMTLFQAWTTAREEAGQPEVGEA